MMLEKLFILGKVFIPMMRKLGVSATTHKGARNYQGDKGNEGSGTVISCRNP
jgi:hypothetical protein